METTRAISRYRAPLLVAGLLFCPILCRFVGGKGASLFRSFIYLVLYAAWGFSLNSRILHPQTRRLLVGEAVLMVFWFVVRTVKFTCALPPTAIRYLWYLYYLPMLFIPLLALLASLTFDRSDKYRLPAGMRPIFFATVALLFLVLTNDLHQFVFRFPSDKSWNAWSDLSYRYGPGYYLVLIWVILCGTWFFAIMFSKYRPVRRCRYLPLLPMGFAILYTGLYISEVPWLRTFFGDTTAIYCLLCASMFELSLTCGLIRSNTGYEELFSAGSLGAQILDFDGEIRLAGAGAVSLSDEKRREAVVMSPIYADPFTIVKSKAITDGYVLWHEDVTALIEANEKIEEYGRELAERNQIRRRSLEIKKEIHGLREKNRANSLLQAETGSQLNLIYEMLRACEGRPYDTCRQLLAGTAVLCAYIKRCGILLLLAERSDTAGLKELARCFQESLDNLELLGAECFCDISRQSLHRTKDMLRIYRSFEQLVETCLFDVRFVWVKARDREDSVLLSVEFSCEADLSRFAASADGFFYEDEAYRFNYILEKAGERS